MWIFIGVIILILIIACTNPEGAKLIGDFLNNIGNILLYIVLLGIVFIILKSFLF